MLRRTRSDEALLLAVGRGSARALDELLGRHRDRIFRVCLSVLGSPEDAADATQETLISIVHGIESFDGRAQFTTWLHRIALRKALDARRRRNPDPVDPATLAEPPAGPLAAANAPGGDAPSGAELVAAISALDEGFREAYTLVEVCGASLAEAAATLEVAVGTVKSRLFRARAQLAATLAAAGLAPGTFADDPASDGVEGRP